MNEIGKKLVLLFERHRVMDIETVRQNLQGRSRRSAFRDLNRAGYCSAGATPIDSALIASGLAKRGIAATVEQIERMMKHYDIKTNGL